jgi:tetratricopeptide (TPR) repeat protein
MARTKIIKKKLKEPDEFISLTERTFVFITHHSKSFAVGGIIILILILSIFFFLRAEKKNEENAYQMLSLAIEAYQTVNTPNQEGSLQDYRNVLEKFNEVIKSFPRTSSGKLSILYEGNLHLRLGAVEEAIKAYESFIQKSGKEKLYRSFAMEGLGYSYEEQKDYEKAIDVYQKILQLRGDFQSPNVYLGIGRCYEKLGKTQEALENYKYFLKSFPKSSMAFMIMRKISHLEK